MFGAAAFQMGSINEEKKPMQSQSFQSQRPSIFQRLFNKKKLSGSTTEENAVQESPTGGLTKILISDASSQSVKSDAFS